MVPVSRPVGRLVASLAVVIAGCAAPPAATPAPTQAPTVAPATAAVAVPTPTPTASPSRAPQRFPSGLYVIRPSLQHPGGIVELAEPSSATVPRIEVFGPGWDVHPDVIVGGIGDGSGLTLFSPDGTSRQVKVPGLFGIGRPSLSPDGKRAFVQASERPAADPSTAPLFTVYVVDLAAGSFRRIGDLPQSRSTQSEQTAWFPSGDRVAYWTTANNCLVIKVRDVSSAADLLTIGRDGTAGCYQPLRGILDGPRFHVAVSADSSKILSAGQLQVYDAKTGALLADVHQKAFDGLAAAGYKPDARFPGQAGGGTFPLDGAFSPDGKQIVFDGAVEKDGQFGVILCRIDLDGTGFTVLRPPVQVDPRFSNNHNYSQVLPRWR